VSHTTHTQADFLSDFLEPFHFELERRQEMVDGTLTRRFGGYRDGSVGDDGVAGEVVVDVDRARAEYTHLTGFDVRCAMITHKVRRRPYDDVVRACACVVTAQLRSDTKRAENGRDGGERTGTTTSVRIVLNVIGSGTELPNAAAAAGVVDRPARARVSRATSARPAAVSW